MFHPIRTLRPRALLGLLVLLAGSAGAEPAVPWGRYMVRWFGADAGLYGESATAMAQTSDGFLWFGTFAGLARFDGMGFDVLDPKNTPELPNAGIVNVYRDRADRLWVSTYGGLVCRQGGKWHRFTRQEGWTTRYARTFAESPDGTVYVTGFDSEILRYQGGRFTELPKPLQQDGGVLGCCDAEGRFWAVKPGFVGYWEGDGWRGVLAAQEIGPDWQGSGPSRDGKVWLLNRSQLRKVDRTGTVRTVPLDRPVEKFWDLHELANGEVWIASFEDGLYRVQLPPVDSASGVGRVTQVGSLGGREIHSVRMISEDDEGNLWVGTGSEDLARLTPRPFQTLGTESGLPSPYVRSVSVDTNGRLWVATFGGGVCRCDDPLAPGPSFAGVAPELNPQGSSILADRAGRIWAEVLGPGGPVLRLDEVPPRVVHKDEVGQASRTSTFEDAKGRVWFGGLGELLVLAGQEWQRHPLPNVHAFAENPARDELWVASPNQLYLFREGGFKPVVRPNDQSFEAIQCLYLASDGNLWMGTPTAGLILRRPDGTVATVGRAEGLPLTGVCAMAADDVGWLWLLGDGIARVSLQELARVAAGQASRVGGTRFSPDDGLLRNGVVRSTQHPAIARTADGRLWFATQAGLAVVSPKDVQINSQPPRLQAASVKFSDRDGVARILPLSPGTQCRIPAGARRMSFAFAALSYRAPERVQCAVRLEREGQLVTEHQASAREAAYELLPPGNYTLKITAANECGVWSPKGAEVRFRMEPFYWQTAWFRAGVAVLVLGAVFGVAAYWVRQARLTARLALAERDRQWALEQARNAEALRQSELRRQQAEAEAQLRRQRGAVVRDVHDGLGGLAANLRMVTSLALHATEPSAQRAHLQTLDSLAIEALGEVHGLMDTLEAETVDCAVLADEFRRYGGLMLDPHGIRLKVNCPAAQPALPPDPQRVLGLFRTYKEAIANVVKHAHAQNVQVDLETTPGGLRLTIADDGVGLPAGPRAGRGLRSMERRVTEWGGIMRVQSGPGLRLTFEIPWPKRPDQSAPAPAAEGTVTAFASESRPRTETK